MPYALANMTLREKIILVITILIALFAIVYYAYLKNYIAEYRQTTQDIVDEIEERKMQEAILQGQARIERQFNEIRSSVAIRKDDKSPQAAFIEDIAGFVTSTTTISPHWVETVAGAPEYAYLVISISGLRGPYSEITEILKGFNQRQLLIRHLRIQRFRPDSDPSLTLSANLAQLVRVSDLDAEDQENIRKALENQR